MFIDFATLAMDTLVNQSAKYRYMSGGQLAVPMVVRTQAGARGSRGTTLAKSRGMVCPCPGAGRRRALFAGGSIRTPESAIRLGDPVLVH